MAALIEAQLAKIKEIVCDTLEIDPPELTETGLFTEQYGADSLQAIEILAGVERAFRVVVDQSQLARMVNLEGVCAVVAEACAGEDGEA